MVRLIDADALLASLPVAWDSVIRAIEDAPTVDAAEALEKQRPQKPRATRYALMCSRCGHKITEIGCAKKNRRYCKKCGQKIDWGDDDG